MASKRDRLKSRTGKGGTKRFSSPSKTARKKEPIISKSKKIVAKAEKVVGKSSKGASDKAVGISVKVKPERKTLPRRVPLPNYEPKLKKKKVSSADEKKILHVINTVSKAKGTKGASAKRAPMNNAGKARALPTSRRLRMKRKG